MQLTLIPIFFIFFLSGVAGLVYEVLWVKQLGLLFGNTAQAVAAVTAAFFIGIAAGSYFWGKQQNENTRPLLTYAYLEFGIVGAALLYFLIFELWDVLYPTLFAALGNYSGLMSGIKLLLAIALICPATFLMGGTLPVMGQYLIRSASELSRWSGILYGVNTLGTTIGALAAGFFLPQYIGFLNSYGVALAMSLTVAIIAWLIARTEHLQEGPNAELEATPSNKTQFTELELIAFISGFVSLGLQVLWTRMFVQVLQNSVYTFAAILTIFLTALAFGAFISRVMVSRIKHDPSTISLLLIASGIAVLLVPFGFMGWTDGMKYIATGTEFTEYILEVMLAVGVLIGIPMLIMGTLLPYLYRYAENSAEAPGVIIGRLNGWNTLGAVLGSLFAGFVLLDWLGLWSSIRLMGMLYLVTAVYFMIRSSMNTTWVIAGLILLLTPVSLLDPSKLPVIRIEPIDRNEALLELWEGSGGTVAVVKREEGLRTKLNNWYTLGGSGAAEIERMQTLLPMNLHSNPEEVFYLGLGTGITAGASLEFSVKKVVVAELVGDVITASKKYFTEHTNGLYADERVKVVNEDGRNYLRATQENFDLIISDLFIPWRSGVGYLYTVEHFETSKARLKQDGLFVQWVPMFQVSDREFGIIARSMLEVFPRVTVWRGDFYAENPIVAIIGHQSDAMLSPSAPISRLSEQALQIVRAGQGDPIPLLAHYLGPITTNHELVRDSLVNTDDLPWIQYLAPETHRQVNAKQQDWFVGEPLLTFMQEIQQQVKPQEDPYLSELSPDLQRAVYAGFFFHVASVARDKDRDKLADTNTERAKRLLK